jgi:phytoene dehydrogenase-like protein
MADKSYDAVIIGGGHHGLVIGCYLARNGMSVAVFERRFEVGGGAASEETPLPGWVRDTHAHFIRFFSSPAYHDFKLWEKGLKLIFPPGASNSCLWTDGTAIAMKPVYKVQEKTSSWPYLPEAIEENAKQVAAFSKKDADTCYELAQKYYSTWKEYVDRWHLNPPPPLGEKDLDEILVERGLVNPEWITMDTGAVAYDIFESPQLREYYMRLAQGHTGIYPGQPQHLMLTLHTLGSMLGGLPISISAGGTHNIAHALQRALSEQGGDFFVLSEVDKILIKNGRAIGVKLVDGTEVEARKLVICDTHVRQVVERFIGKENTPDPIFEKVSKVHSDIGAWWFHFCYHELPRYKHQATHPDCLTQRQYMMPLQPDWFRYTQYEEFKKGQLPTYIYFHLSHPSAFDPRWAPEGKHCSIVEVYGPPVSYVGMEWYDTIDPPMVERIIEQWQWYAPNMTKDNIIAYSNTSVRDMAERLIDMPNGCWPMIDMSNDQMGQRRPIPEYSRYRTHIDNVYICSSVMHPGGALHGFCGYNCYKRIAEDYGLEKVWETMGRKL